MELHFGKENKFPNFYHSRLKDFALNETGYNKIW